MRLEAFGLAVGLGFTIEASAHWRWCGRAGGIRLGGAIALGTVACAVLALDLRRNVSV